MRPWAMKRRKRAGSRSLHKLKCICSRCQKELEKLPPPLDPDGEPAVVYSDNDPTFYAYDVEHEEEKSTKKQPVRGVRVPARKGEGMRKKLIDKARAYNSDAAKAEKAGDVKRAARDRKNAKLLFAAAKLFEKSPRKVQGSSPRKPRS